ncbi:hypothetical protein N0V82_005142 [Gnomoniopsis sp. IMI 355080]|nr:hypothetical protein N0V82_005142 [Gnomoniopsis sp. IMI 355080]
MAHQVASSSGAGATAVQGQAISPTLPGLWGKALLATTINKEEREALFSITQQFGQLQTSADPISGLIAALQQKQETCQQKRWHVRIGERDIILRDVAAKVISVLDVFKAVGDTAVSANPGVAALPWAFIRFLLQVAIEERSQMYALLSSIESISRISSRCRVYEVLFMTGTMLPSHGADSELQNALVVTYAHVLKAVVHTASRLEQGTVKRAWTAVARPQETTGLLQELAKCDTYVCAAAASCIAVQIAGIKDAIPEIKDQVINGFSDLQLRSSEIKVDLQALGFRLDALEPDVKQIEQQTSDSKAMFNFLHNFLKKIEMPLFRVDERVTNYLKEVENDRMIRILDWVSSVKVVDHHRSASDSRTPDTCDWLLEDPRFLDWQMSSSSVVLVLYGTPGTGKTYLVSRIVDWLLDGISGANSDESFAFFYCKRSEVSRRDPLQVLRSIVRQLAVPHKRANLRGLIHQKIHDQYNAGRETAANLNFEACRAVLKEFFETYPQTTIVLDALDECDKDCRHELMSLFDELLAQAPRPIKLFVASRPDVDITEHFHERAFINIRATENHEDINKYIHAEVQKHPRWSRLNQAFRIEISSTLLHKSDGMFQWAALQIRQLLKLRTENAIRDRLGRLPNDLRDAYDEIYNEIDKLHCEDKQIAHRAFQWVMCAETPLARDALLHAVCQDPASGEYQEPREEIDEALILDLCHNLLVFDTDLNHWRFSHFPQGNESPAMFSAVKNSSTDTIKLLLSKGGNVNAAMSGESNLLVAAIRARKKSSLMIKWLIQYGANVTATSPCEFGSPVAAAAYFADLKSLRRLLEAGADPQLHIPGKWGSALAAAAASTKPESQVLEVLKLLVEYGSDPNTLLGENALESIPALVVAHAEFSGMLEPAENILDIKKFHCALHVAVMRLESGCYSSQIVQALIDAGADVNLEPPRGLRHPGRYSALGVIFQAAFTGRLPHDISRDDRPQWMGAAELLVNAGAVWYGNLEKLKTGLLRQQDLTTELMDALFCDAFLERLQLNNIAFARV